MTTKEIALNDVGSAPNYKLAYLLMEDYGYDGLTVKGVFTTEELAKKAVASIPENERLNLRLYEIGMDQLLEGM